MPFEFCATEVHRLMTLFSIANEYDIMYVDFNAFIVLFVGNLKYSFHSRILMISWFFIIFQSVLWVIPAKKKSIQNDDILQLCHELCLSLVFPKINGQMERNSFSFTSILKWLCMKLCILWWMKSRSIKHEKPLQFNTFWHNNKKRFERNAVEYMLIESFNSEARMIGQFQDQFGRFKLN